jgi:hypothetical protein
MRVGFVLPGLGHWSMDNWTAISESMVLISGSGGFGSIFHGLQGMPLVLEQHSNGVREAELKLRDESCLVITHLSLEGGELGDVLLHGATLFQESDFILSLLDTETIAIGSFDGADKVVVVFEDVFFVVDFAVEDWGIMFQWRASHTTQCVVNALIVVLKNRVEALENDTQLSLECSERQGLGVTVEGWSEGVRDVDLAMVVALWSNGCCGLLEHLVNHGLHCVEHHGLL